MKLIETLNLFGRVQRKYELDTTVQFHHFKFNHIYTVTNCSGTAVLAKPTDHDVILLPGCGEHDEEEALRIFQEFYNQIPEPYYPNPSLN